MLRQSFDLIVVGGGRSCNLAEKVAAAGWKVAIVERDELGGTCPNRGCVPSKMLIGFADAYRAVKHSQNHFISSTIESVDRAAMFASARTWSKKIDPKFSAKLKRAGAVLFRGNASFADDRVVQVVRGTEPPLELTAPTVVLATGSRPRPIPKQFEHLPLWTSDDVFLCEDAPKSLIIIGGGFIGSEMGSFFSNIGVPTKLLIREQELLTQEDRDIGAVVKQEFAKHTDAMFGVSVSDISFSGELDEFTVTLNDGSVHRAQKVMFATGRIPNTDSLNLDKTAIKLDSRGFIAVDNHLESSVPGIYAAGDVAGKYMLQHTAAFEVNYLKERLLAKATAPIEYGMVPHAVFCHPEVASIGKTEQQLEKEGVPFVSSFTQWEASAKVQGMRVSYPRTKMLVCPHTYRILGCHLVGPQASTSIHEVAMLIHLKNDVRELLRMIHIHPALNEIFMVSAADIINKVRKFNSSKVAVESKL